MLIALRRNGNIWTLKTMVSTCFCRNSIVSALEVLTLHRHQLGRTTDKFALAKARQQKIKIINLKSNKLRFLLYNLQHHNIPIQTQV